MHILEKNKEASNPRILSQNMQAANASSKFWTHGIKLLTELSKERASALPVLRNIIEVCFVILFHACKTLGL